MPEYIERCRSMVLEKVPTQLDQNEKQSYEISFSSEYPALMGDVYEILSHDPGCCDLQRLQSGVVPLLFNHDHAKIIGRVLNGYIDQVTKKGRAEIVFSESPLGQQCRQQFEEDILVNVSFGYRVYTWVPIGENRVLATVWEPYEISLVSAPSDPTVGKNRSQQKELKVMPTAARREAEEQAREEHRVRIISDLGRKFVPEFGRQAAELAAKLVEDGTPVELARSQFADLWDQRPAPTPIAGPTDMFDLAGMSKRSLASLGLSAGERGQYSLLNAIKGIATGQFNQCGFELELSQEMQRQDPTLSTRGLLVPLEALSVRAPAVTGTPSYAGSLVETEFRPDSFIGALRNRMVMSALGVRITNGCQGNQYFPRQSNVSSLGWIGENAQLPEGNPQFDGLSLTPKTCGVFTEVGRLMQVQASMDLENLIRQDFAAQLAVELDKTMVHGTGSANQPRGILNTAGISAIALGANGSALTWANILDLEAQLGIKNADFGAMGWLTTPKVRKALKNTLQFPSAGSNPVWMDSPGGEGQGMIAGYKALSTNSVRSDLTKGTGTNLSALVFGNWEGLQMCTWGALSLETDPHYSFRTGGIGIRCMIFADMGLRNPESFAAVTDAVAS